jgi:hypothetical protein
MPGYAYTQEQKFSTRVLHIAGSRVLTAPQNQALPTVGQVLIGAEPSAYFDHGSIVSALVEINLELTRESIDLGRVPTPARFYLSAQKGTIRFRMQEYQPEYIDLAAGGTGTLETGSGFVRSYLGGKLGTVRRILILDDFDTVVGVDAEPWYQFWFTNPNAQCGGTFARGEEKAAFVIPIEYDLLRFSQGGFNRLLEFRAISTP